MGFTTGVSAVTITGILLAGFTFAATEIFYTVSLLGGLGIAMRPLLSQKKEETSGEALIGENKQSVDQAN